jgi:tetratricopeptide (TPR) repeat protein
MREMGHGCWEVFCYNKNRARLVETPWNLSSPVGPKGEKMRDAKNQTVEDRLVGLLKLNRKDLKGFVRSVEKLVPPEGDVAGFLDEMGAVLASQDRSVGALELWDRAARLYEDQGRLEELAWLYANMGPVAAMAGDIPRGIRFSRKADDLSRQLSADPDLIYHVSSDLGAMYAELGDWEKAMFEDSRALEVSRSAEDCAGQIRALLALAQVCLVRGDLTSARAEAMGAVSLARSCGGGALEAEAMRVVGDVSQASGDHEQAIRQYAQGLELEAVSPDSETRAQLHFAMSVSYDALGDAKNAARERNLAEVAGLSDDMKDTDDDA